jgi:DNA polymerase
VSPQNDILIRYLRQQVEMYGSELYVVPAEAQPVDVLPPDLPAVPPPQPRAPLAPTSLEEFRATICECLNCPLGHTRKSFVFGSGNPNADIMVIGEAPGADEDEQGLPFVGRAGQLLTKILEAIELQRDEVYICNILKCRPPNNRKPLASETDQCEPYLWQQIALIKPKYILALGLTAANTLLKNKASMSELRGRTHDYQGIPTIVTYHPAALLRNPEWKKLAWEDVKYLRTLYTASR